MRKLLALFLFAAAAAHATNFTFVQKTPNSSTGALSQAFGSNTTAGNFIIAIVYGPASGAAVTDSSSNTYTRVAVNNGGFPATWLFVALNIAGGADTVTATSGSGGILASEYHSVASTYYVCPATTGVAGSPATGQITNTSFVSSHEVLTVWGVDYNGTTVSWAATTGTVRYQATMPFNFTTSTAGGDDDTSSMSTGGSYVNTVKVSGTTPSSEALSAVFVNTDNPSCLGPGGGPHTFSILY